MIYENKKGRPSTPKINRKKFTTRVKKKKGNLVHVSMKYNNYFIVNSLNKPTYITKTTISPRI